MLKRIRREVRRINEDYIVFEWRRSTNRRLARVELLALYFVHNP